MKHPLKKELTENQHIFLMESIQQQNTEVYNAFLMDLLKKKTQFKIDVLKALSDYKPTFTEELLKKIIKQIETNDTFLNKYFETIKEDESYIPLLSILLRHGLWTDDFMEYYLVNSENRSMILELLDDWLSYKKLKRKKIVDPTTDGYFKYFNELTVHHQRILLKKILPHLVLNPTLELMSPCKIELFRENIFIYTMYLKNIAEFLKSLETRIQKDNHPNDVHIRNLFIEQFPFKKKSQFRCVLDEMDKAKFSSRTQTDYHKQLEETVSFLKNFMYVYYDSKDKKIEDAWEYVKYDYFKQRNYDISMPLEAFLNQLPDLHQKMILLRTKEELHQYTPNLKLEELNQDDVYGLTPIAYAILFKNYEAVDYLITTSASFQHKDTIGKKKVDYDRLIPYTRQGISILDLAKYVNFKKVIHLLETKEKIKKRWHTNTKIGFHQTTPDVVNIIQNSHKNEYWFLAGSTGMYGAGIYFAETARETNYKALHKGIILRNEVYLGHPMYIHNFKERDDFALQYRWMDCDILHEALQKRKYDSVIAVREGKKEGQFMRTGTEYVVYNTEQVKMLEVLPELPSQVGGSEHHFTLPNWVLPLQQNDLDKFKEFSKTFVQRWILNTTPLMIACANGNITIVQWLLQNYPTMIHEQDFMGRNAIYYAIQGGDSHVLRQLISHNIDVFVQDYEGHYVVDYFNQKDIQKHLENPTDRFDTSYRTVLLDHLYQLGDKAHSLIVRFYAKTGRLNQPSEQKRYEAFLLNIQQAEQQPIPSSHEYTPLVHAGKKNKRRVKNVSKK